jgi:hypothetical protein
MSARTNELLEANQSLSRRLDTASRNADENRVALDDMSKRLERHQKRNHEELERLDEELIVAKAERDTFRSQAEIREVEIQRLKKHRVDGDAFTNSDRQVGPIAQPSVSKGSAEVGKQSGRENMSMGRAEGRYTKQRYSFWKM